MMKRHEWLAGLNSHDIYDAKRCAADFIHRTGCVPNWPTHTAAETLQAIQDRGLGGQYSNPGDVDSCYGWEIAAALARDYANFESDKHGRGRIFDECLIALQRADL